jgi:hypothetical protein
VGEGSFLLDLGAVRGHLVARGETVEDRANGFGVGKTPYPGPDGLVTLAWIKPGIVHAYAVHPDAIPEGRRVVVARQLAALNALMPVPGFGLLPGHVAYTVYAPLGDGGGVSSAVVDRLIELARHAMADRADLLAVVLAPRP